MSDSVAGYSIFGREQTRTLLLLDPSRIGIVCQAQSAYRSALCRVRELCNVECNMLYMNSCDRPADRLTGANAVLNRRKMYKNFDIRSKISSRNGDFRKHCSCKKKWGTIFGLEGKRFSWKSFRSIEQAITEVCLAKKSGFNKSLGISLKGWVVHRFRLFHIGRNRRHMHPLKEYAFWWWKWDVWFFKGYARRCSSKVLALYDPPKT